MTNNTSDNGLTILKESFTDSIAFSSRVTQITNEIDSLNKDIDRISQNLTNLNRDQFVIRPVCSYTHSGYRYVEGENEQLDKIISDSLISYWKTQKVEKQNIIKEKEKEIALLNKVLSQGTGKYAK